MSIKKTGKILSGVVYSSSMDKTAVVGINYIEKHPLYKKYINRRKKYMAHDAENACDVGDRVEIQEVRPLSKRKRWVITKILEKAKKL